MGAIAAEGRLREWRTKPNVLGAENAITNKRVHWILIPPFGGSNHYGPFLAFLRKARCFRYFAMPGAGRGRKATPVRRRTPIWVTSLQSRNFNIQIFRPETRFEMKETGSIFVGATALTAHDGQFKVPAYRRTLSTL